MSDTVPARYTIAEWRRIRAALQSFVDRIDIELSGTNDLDSADADAATMATDLYPNEARLIDDARAHESVSQDHRATIERPYDTEDCPYCDGTGDNRTDPDYSYPIACYACGGSGISRVQPPREEEPREDTYTAYDWF